MFGLENSKVIIITDWSFSTLHFPIPKFVYRFSINLTWYTFLLKYMNMSTAEFVAWYLQLVLTTHICIHRNHPCTDCLGWYDYKLLDFSQRMMENKMWSLVLNVVRSILRILFLWECVRQFADRCVWERISINNHCCVTSKHRIHRLSSVIGIK